MKQLNCIDLNSESKVLVTTRIRGLMQGCDEISLNLAGVDVSEDNDWSAVRVESFKGSLGRVYPIDGFIYPNYSTEQ